MEILNSSTNNNDIDNKVGCDDEDEFIESIGLKALNYKNVIERYYTKIYINKNLPNEQYLFIHSNGIALCGLGENHFITKSEIVKVKDLNKISQFKGKKKNGARVLNEVEYVLEIEYIDKNEHLESNHDSNFTPRIFKFNPGLKGVKLMEINANLFTNHNLLKEFPEKFGFICIVFLDNKQVENWINKNQL